MEGILMNFANLLQKVIVIFSRKYILFFALSFLLNFSNLLGQINPYYPDNVYDVKCSKLPDEMKWGIKVAWSSSNIISTLNIPLVGDLNDDGIPEIVCFGSVLQSNTDPRKVKTVLVFNGKTHNLLNTITLPEYVTGYDAAAYGLVKIPNGQALIVVACYDYKLRAYDITPSNVNTPVWVSNIDYGLNYGDFAVNIGFADFNNDGFPEIYLRDKIYDASTGVLLAQASGGNNTGSSWAHFTHVTSYKLSSPFATDIVGDKKLELILGNEIYSVNITNRFGTTGNSITLIKTITPPSSTVQDGHAQVADFNNDGYLDVFISNRDVSGSYGIVAGYIWDVYNNRVSTPFKIQTNFSGKSIPLIADIDNDGDLEILIQCGVSGSNSKIRAYKYDKINEAFVLLWDFLPNEDSFSNGATLFDFNQDGINEILISDQSNIFIVNGSGKSHITGVDTIPVYIMTSLKFGQVTIMQYPIIADIDADGSAEIIAVGTPGSSSTLTGSLNIFKSSTTPWAPARKVWNQYNYNVVNINEDLTVSKYQFNPATTFTNPNTGAIHQPFNHFLQQVGPVNQYGEPFNSIADLTFITDSVISYFSSDSFFVKLPVYNQGSVEMKPPLEITVYKDTFRDHILKRDTIHKSIKANNHINHSLSFKMNELNSFLPIKNMIFAVNDNGIEFAHGSQIECDTNNNTLIYPITKVFNITASICQNQPYIEYGFNLPTDSTAVAGIFHFQQNLYSVFGYDSIVDLKLTVHPTYLTELNEQPCDYYEFIDTTYRESGIYTKKLTTIAGCDSVIKLNLIIHPSYDSTFTITACNSYNWNNEIYTQSGNYANYLTSVHGCDSIVYLNLTINPSHSITLEDSITISESYNENGFEIPIQTERGILTFEQNLENQWGCDSTIQLILHVIPPFVDHSVDLDFPNAFTPEKETNNYFSIGRKRNVKDLKIFIYNRWGGLVYKSSDINFQWDGRDSKGLLVPIGAYVYMIEYHSETAPDITLEKTGIINIVR